jgi:hypothetical protein
MNITAPALKPCFICLRSYPVTRAWYAVIGLPDHPQFCSLEHAAIAIRDFVRKGRPA